MRNRWPIIVGVVLVLGLMFICGVCIIGGVGGGLAGLDRLVKALPTFPPTPELEIGNTYWIGSFGIGDFQPVWVGRYADPEMKNSIGAGFGQSAKVRLDGHQGEACYVVVVEAPIGAAADYNRVGDEGWTRCRNLLSYEPTPMPTRITTPERPTITVAPSPTLQPETYGEFSLVLFERAEAFQLKGEFLSPTGSLSWELGPEEGIDIALVVVRLTNTGDRWIFPWVMPGWLTDAQGARYRERFDFLIDEQGDPDSPDAIVLYGESGSLVLTGGLADEKVGPGESLLMGFVVHVPKGREIASFMFQYEVWETAMPLVGERWIMEAIVPIGE